MKQISWEISDGIAVLKVNRPEALNALNRQTLEEMQHFLDLTAKQEKLKAIILTGSGEKAFIAGADIKEMQMMSPFQLRSFWALGQVVAETLETAPFLTIAAVNGYALGGGLEMALACDFIYASHTSKLGLPEVCLEVMPCFGGIQRLSRAIGTRPAKELIMSGRFISATEAQVLGLVNRVCESENLLSECFKVAHEITQHSPLALLNIKNAINNGERISLTEAIAMETEMCVSCFAAPAREAAMSAFLHKLKK